MEGILSLVEQGWSPIFRPAEATIISVQPPMTFAGQLPRTAAHAPEEGLAYSI